MTCFLPHRPSALYAFCLSLILSASVTAQETNTNEVEAAIRSEPSNTHQAAAIVNNSADWDPLKPGIVLTVSAPYIEMHTFAGRAYPIFHVIEKGEQLKIYKRRNEWFKARTADGKLGWINRRQLAGTIDDNGQHIGVSKTRWQDYIENRYRVSIMAGQFETIASYSPSLGIQWTQNIATEIRLGQAFGDVSTFKYGSLNILHKPFPHWRIQPFVHFGAGTIDTEPSSVTADPDNRRDTLITVGVGVDAQLNPTFSLRVEYDSHTILTNRSENVEVEEWKAGFSVLF